MSVIEPRDLGLTDKNGGCSCCAPADNRAAAASPAMDSDVQSDYLVDGMTCSHCVSSVTEELSALEGVESVRVDLKAGGTSRVTVASSAPLDAGKVRQAIEEAGYRLAPAS